MEWQLLSGLPFKVGVVYGDGRGRFHHGNGSGNDARIVAAFDFQGFGFSGFQIHRLLGLCDGGGGLEGGGEDQGHSVGDTAQNAAAVV